MLYPLWLIRALHFPTGMGGAFHNAGLLHCDTSSGNVMLTENRSGQIGVLNDWDRSKRVGTNSTVYNPRTVRIHVHLLPFYRAFLTF